MQMTWRWYGIGNDHISLSDIKQIPGVEGIVWALHNYPAGEVWPLDEILKEKELINSFGFNIDVVESVNVHEDIKLGKSMRDEYINNYCTTLRNLAKAGVKVVTYNFMPVFDWTRTDLYHQLDDGSNALFYEKDVANVDVDVMIKNILDSTNSMTMPGWEPERLANVKERIKEYSSLTEEDLWDNLKYFLDRVIPVAKECDIKMAIHPDDPPWSIFGLHRLIINKQNIEKFLSLYDSQYNGLAICTGSLGASEDNDLVDIVSTFASKIHFIHIRNVKVYENGDFCEVSHRSCDGRIDVYRVLKTLHKNGYKGYIRPDHGRHLWGEEKVCRPGYGLYDRALGVMYMLGIIDSLREEVRDDTN